MKIHIKNSMEKKTEIYIMVIFRYYLKVAIRHVGRDRFGNEFYTRSIMHGKESYRIEYNSL